MRAVGTRAFGVRTPVIRKGDDLVKIVADCVENAAKEQQITLHDKDIVAVTEAVVATSDNNFVTEEDIANDVRRKMGEGKVGVVLPILSRNRFSSILKGIVKACDEVCLLLSYPTDEVGNPLVSVDKLFDLGIVKYDKKYTSEEFYNLVGKVEHPFTGLDYINIYQEICGKNAKVIISNDVCDILEYTKKVICADVHSRERTKKLLLKSGAEKVISIAEILNEESDKHGYNKQYGLLGSNKSTEGVLKLFPKNGEEFVFALQAELKKRTGKTIECMVYGDGAFKDPVGGIWELADPVVSPAYTNGLSGTPNEIKLKYVADNDLANCSREIFDAQMKNKIKNKTKGVIDENNRLGTTPRRIVDLVGSLADLVSGSGDKGTPVVLITGYFDNYADD